MKEQDTKGNSLNKDASTGESTGYKPNKKQRECRHKLWGRYNDMIGDTLREEIEADWEDADKMFRQWSPTPDPDDWRANLTLPDGFAAIQAQMQETIERKSRPILKRVEDTDVGKERFANVVMKYSMDRTGFDYQYFLAKYAAAIRGTAFLMDYYRVDKREIQDAKSVDKEGVVQYVTKEVIDYDDDYTEWVPNEYIYVDPDARSIDDAKDMIHREIIDIDEFKRRYAFKKDFINVDLVRPSSETVNKAFFRPPKDLNANQVEVLHYFNRATDEYNVLANNVICRMGPIPNKHKELPLAVVYHYQVPGQFWGMGIPKVINSLTEERKSLRNLRLDRQKMQLNKMFLKNSAVGDFDEDETVTRPFGIIEVETNGLPLNQAIQPLEYGDVPASAFKEEDTLLEDIRRAHGIDDRIQGVQMGGTATEAAILKESSQKRINLITQLSEMNTIIRLGRLKWSNIQFFYKAPRIERVFEGNEKREKKIYKKVQTDGDVFTIVEGDKGPELKWNQIGGSATYELDKDMAQFMEGDYDIAVDSVASMVISKPIQQAKITEVMTLIASNPMWLAQLDAEKSLARIYEIFDEKPSDWMRNQGISKEDMQMLADEENELMSAGTPLGPTPNATEEHTLVHVNFASSSKFEQLPTNIQELITNHILAEHDANPATGSSADMLSAAGVQPNNGDQGTPGANPDTAQQGMPQMPGMGMTPSTVTGEEPNTSQNAGVGPA